MNTDKERIIFLLGGDDLEMSSIKELFLKEGYKEGKDFFDKKLKWGAKLSEYQEELEEFINHIIYGIELEEDIDPPKNYKAIDHHNHFSDKEASIIQILTLLDKKPTREQMLIAHNDVGHIEAMRCFGATEDEIVDIRKKDRVSQGVTAKEEAQSLEEIKNIKEENGVYLLNTSLSKFSPIVDNFEKRPLLLYSDKSLTYYGDIEFLKNHYKEQIEKNQAYHGRGYFGFDSKYVALISSKKLAKEILEMKKEKNIISYHNFMFPFRFDKLDKPITDRHEFYKNNKFDKRVKIDKEFIENLKKDNWEYQEFEIKTTEEYNEFVYFHDFARDTLFNTADIDEDKFEWNATSYYFYKDISESDTFELSLLCDKKYLLNLVGLSLRIFDTGVGLLSLELENREIDQSSLDDILKINDFGRRIYPQYLGSELTVDTKKSFLADKVVVKIGNESYEENFSYTDVPKEIVIADYILKLLGTNTFTTKKDEISKNFIQPSIDDRMFVLSWYADKAYSESLKNYKYIKDDKWYEYVFVDGAGKTINSPRMQKKLIKESTYDRWMNSPYGLTLYGMSRYSFVCLSASDFPLAHMKSMYFQMFTLLLTQRASILRFSDEVTALSDIESQNMETQISSLYKNYIRFVNKLYFREVTPQDQGLEVYNQARGILRIDNDIKDLDNEIEELHKYASMLEESRQAQEMNKLSKLGTYLVPPTLVAGFLGMNVFGNRLESNCWIAGAVIATIASPFIVKFFVEKEKK